MSKKLGVFMLSLAVVMFAVTSVFATPLAEEIEINPDDEYASQVATEGYNYKAKYTVSLAEEATSGPIGNVVWEVYPYNSADVWFSYRVESADTTSTIYLDGVFPKYVEDDDAANTHYFYVAAHVSADVENEDYDPDVSGSQEYITKDYVLYAGDATLDDQGDEDERQWVVVATDAADETTVGLFEDMVSVDVSEGRAIDDARKDNYSILINFPMTTAVTIAEDTDDDDNTITTRTSGDIFANAVLEYTLDPEDPDSTPIDPSAISLPSWLAYEVVDTQHPGSYQEDDDGNLVAEYDADTTYVKTLRIFYSADFEPTTEMFGSVRLIVTPSDIRPVTDERYEDDDPKSEAVKSFAELYENGTTIGWSVKFSPIPVISLDLESADVSVDFGSNKVIVVNYANQHPASVDGVIFSPDISDKVTLSVDVAQANADASADSVIPSGTITVTVIPVAPFTDAYSTDMIVTDTEGNPVTMSLNIDVNVGSLDVTPESADLSLFVGESKDVVLTATVFGGKVSWDLGTIPEGITVTEGNGAAYATEYNSVVAYTVTGGVLGTYSFDVTATDSRDETKTVTVYVAVVPPVIKVAAATASVSVGASTNVTLTATEYSGDVSWKLGTVPSGVTVAPATNVAYATEHNTRMVYTVTGVTEGTHNVDVLASDDTGMIHVPLTVTVTSGTSLAFSESSVSTTIASGASADVSLSVTNNKGNVTWTLGTIPTGLAVEPASDTSYATQYNTVMVYTVVVDAAMSAGNYSVPVTATDEGGKTAEATINVTVTATSDNFEISPAVAYASVTAGGIKDTVNFSVGGNSGLVTWTLGTVPTGITVVTAAGTSYATQYSTVMLYDVTAASSVSVGSYSVTVTATDAGGQTARATINIEVTSAGNAAAKEWTSATQEMVSNLVSNGSLNADYSLPEKSLSYQTIDPTARTLSQTGTTSVRSGEAINPVDLVLDFPVDIWRIYINDVLVAWAYSPSFSGTEYEEDGTVRASDLSGNGITIEPESKTKATVYFDTDAMAAGSNEIEAAFVAEGSDPSQEIGRTTLATVSVSDDPTSGDVKGVGSSSGGCSAGLGAMVSALAAAFFIGKKRS